MDEWVGFETNQFAVTASWTLIVSVYQGMRERKIGKKNRSIAVIHSPLERQTTYVQIIPDTKMSITPINTLGVGGAENLNNNPVI